MDETTKEKLNWQRLLITLGIVLVTATAVGGSVWYIMDQNDKSINDSNNKSVSELQSQIDKLKNSTAKANRTTPTTASTANSGTNSTATTTSGWQTYTNPTFGYTLKYPVGYYYSELTDTKNEVKFGLDERGNNFGIYLTVTKTQGNLATYIQNNYRGNANLTALNLNSKLAGYTFLADAGTNSNLKGVALSDGRYFYVFTEDSVDSNFDALINSLTVN